MTTEHPITPPPMLRRLWAQQAQRIDPHDPVAWIEHVATQAARWGDEQRLEANCEWLEKGPYGFTITASAPHMISDLRAASRPKPPSLAEEGLSLIDQSAYLTPEGRVTIRHALERLQQLEQQENND